MTNTSEMEQRARRAEQRVAELEIRRLQGELRDAGEL